MLVLTIYQCVCVTDEFDAVFFRAAQSIKSKEIETKVPKKDI